LDSCGFREKALMGLKPPTNHRWLISHVFWHSPCLLANVQISCWLIMLDTSDFNQLRPFVFFSTVINLMFTCSTLLEALKQLQAPQVLQEKCQQSLEKVLQAQ
jgi:hypothetical protein